MILEKYQIHSKKQERGYSTTAIVQDEEENLFFAKWIKGIEQNSQAGKILFDKLRNIKKATHTSLAKIIEYDWDQTEQAYCIIFEYKEADTLENSVHNIKPASFIKGIENSIACLKKLLQNFRITHGDLNPANILVDENLDFYLIDFGIADICTTLSQEKELEIFAKDFAAPEKWDRTIPKGFPYQSDIYSIGKIVEWYFEKNELPEHETIKDVIDKCCVQAPEERINYTNLKEEISKSLFNSSFEKSNAIEVKGDFTNELIKELNGSENGKWLPKINVRPNSKDNFLLDIYTESYYLHCLWIVNEKHLVIRNFSKKDILDQKQIYAETFAKKIGEPVKFDSYSYTTYNLTPFLKKQQIAKNSESSYKKGKQETNKELKFYKDLLNKELEVLEQNSLRLSFLSFDKKSDYEVWFKIDENEKYSNKGLIFNHIDQSLPPRPEEFEYIISETADKKQIRKPLKFSGIAFDFDSKSRIIKFKDCERLSFEEIPKKGYLFQNISKQEEEKKRQLEAIKKVEFNDVQNRDLMHYLFNSAELKSKYLDIYELKDVYQTDENDIPFEYSANQQRAVINALNREPLTIIQGPPGTGKTTVITEIVLQILNKKPNAKILITSQTNDAVDNVLDNLLEKDIPFVRLSGVRQPKPSLAKHTLEQKIEGWKEKTRKRTKENWKPIKEKFLDVVKDLNSNLLPVVEILSSNKNWEFKVNNLKKEVTAHTKRSFILDFLKSESELIIQLSERTGIDFEEYFEKQRIYKEWLNTISSLDESSNLNQKLIDSIRVIGATTNHIASKKYAKYNFEFDYVIMDESGKATTAESLIPLVLAHKAILVGDHRQLRPMLTSTREVEKWLRGNFKKEDDFDSWDDYFNRPSLFEQIITSIDEDFKSQLEVCRRSSIDQVLLTSKCFYEPYGDQAIQPVDRPQGKEHNLNLKVNSSIIFLNIGNDYKSEINGNGSSKNKISANLIPEVLMKLDQYPLVKNYSIGIITGYSAQVNEIKNVLRKNLDYRKCTNLKQENITSSVVDKFQGLEKDIIIFDLVRSRQNTLGFLANANRINVALSRQKKLLIIIGNYDWLMSAEAPQLKEEIPALKRYLKEIKKDWIVNTIEQIF
ncbi:MULTISPECIES: AAA domain-containing protein [unclassified Flavobacterium]|uniref:AAA domain-containing protein n=1 Tax=unclassified Flavobacterium TaxID=196869 RepID=UPI003F905FB0